MIDGRSISLRVHADKSSQGMNGADPRTATRTGTLRIGETIGATVTSISDSGAVKVTTPSGDTFALRFGAIPLTLDLGETISFKISQRVDGDYMAKLLDSGDMDEGLFDRSVSSFLRDMNEKATDDNKRIVSSMMEFDIPVTKENFKSLQGDSRYALRMAELLAGNPGLGELIDVRAELKGVILRLVDALKPSSADPSSGNAPSDHAEPADVHMIGAAAASAGNRSVLNAGIRELASLVQGNEALSDDGMTVSQEEPPRGQKGRGAADSQRMVLDAVDVLRSHTADKGAFFRKLELPVSLMNMASMNDIILGEEGLIAKFEKLGNTISEDRLSGVAHLRDSIVAMADVEISDIESNISSLRELECVVSMLKGSDLIPETSSILDDVRGLKDSYEFLNSISSNLVYLQLPVEYDKSMGNVEIAYRKRRSQKDDTLRIFISIDTQNVGLVQSMIELKGRDARIGFNVDDSVRNMFAGGFDELRESLGTALKDDHVRPAIELGFMERKGRLTAMDLFRSDFPKQMGFELYI